jgi:hypothetical protein
MNGTSVNCNFTLSELYTYSLASTAMASIDSEAITADSNECNEIRFADIRGLPSKSISSPVGLAEQVDHP